jgi:hypothetical protein
MGNATKKVLRASVRVVVLLALVASVMSSAGVPASAQVAANIEFLNPSSFSAAPDTGIVISDQVPEYPEAGDETYRLSAWVSGVPQTPAVEFELLTRAGVSLEVIDDVERVGADTFEADWDIPDTLPDGPYTMRATVASGILGVDNVDQPIMIQRLADRAEITYPDNRGGAGTFGMFTPLPSAAGTDGALDPPEPIGNIDNRYTGAAPAGGTARVRAFYSVSIPGTVPEWIQCGTEEAAGATIPTDDADNGVRCTLTSSSHITSVTAVALVANDTKEGYQDALNQAGDATRVRESYSQVPTSLVVVEGATGTVDGGSCHRVTVELKDQLSREIAGANVDVHAWGPTDKLKFGTGTFDSPASDAPGEGSHATENGAHCFRPENDQNNGPQAEHQIIGGPDMKHIENTTTGTSDAGSWGFQLYLPADESTTERHTSYWEVWLDETNSGSGVNNDAYDTNELCRSGLVGWDGPASSASMNGPTPACSNPPEIDPCENATSQAQPCATDGSITIDAERRNVGRGEKVRFTGDIDSSAACKVGRRVKLQSRRSGAKFRTKVVTRSDARGAWSAERKQRRSKEWRAVAPASEGCDALRSSILKMKVTRKR